MNAQSIGNEKFLLRKSWWNCENVRKNSLEQESLLSVLIYMNGSGNDRRANQPGHDGVMI